MNASPTNMPLSEELSRQFVQQGFVLVRGLCNASQLDRMRDKALADLAAGVGPVEYEAEVGYQGAPLGLDQPGGRTVRRLLNALGRDEIYAQWALSDRLTNTVRTLLINVAAQGTASELSPDARLLVVRAHHNCIMTKQPSYSSATGWHEDTRYWSFLRPDLINVWTALGEESANNGGMRLIPGSHRQHFPDQSFDQARFFRTDYPANQAWLDRAVQMDMQPGDVLFFHAGLLHSAGRNLTNERKLSLVFSYRSSDNHPTAGSRSAATPELDAGLLTSIPANHVIESS